MSTTLAPLDFQRLLLEGAEEAERKYPRISPTPTPPGGPKPDLEDALLARYNRNRAPDQQLKPGELPTPAEPPPPEPGILQKTGKAIAKIPDQIYGALPSISLPGPSAQDPMSQLRPQAPAPAVPAAPMAPTDVRPPLSTAIPEPGTIAAPAPVRQYSPGIYGTLQRHANFVRDIAEAGGQTLAGMGAFAFGAATAVSDILNAQLARVARGGPTAGGPESSTHYRDIFTRMDKTISSLTPEPRSDTAKTLSKGVGAVTGLVKDIAELPGKGLVAAGILNEDTARLLSFGAELYLFYKIDRGVRQAAPELRAKISEFKTRMSRAKTDTEAAGVAQDLADAASKNPKLETALDEARGKFRDEADREAGAAGPREPSPEGGPAGGGAAIDPGDLRAYNESLRQRVEELRTERPDLFGPDADIGALKTELDNVPKPQARGQQPVTTREMMEARLSEQPQPQAEPTPQPQAQAPRAQAAPTVERPVQPEVVVGQERAVAPVTRPAEAPVARPTTELMRTTPERPTPEAIREAEIPPPAQPYVPMTPAEEPAPQAAATVAPETVPAPVSPETPAVAAVPPRASDYYVNAARGFFDVANSPNTPSQLRKESLRDIKTLARDQGGLANLGFTPEEITVLEKELRQVRARKSGTETLNRIAESNIARKTELVPGVPNDVYDFLAREGDATVSAISRRAGLTYPEVNEAIQQLKAEGRIEEVQAGNYIRYRAKPAVQTAATEAVLENAPAGTEVEIPAPSEPVVDSTPVVEKPKRKRRMVKAKTEEQAAREQVAEDTVTEMRGARIALENQRTLVQDMLRSAGLDPVRALADMRAAFNSGIRPLQVRENFVERGMPEDIARRIADMAYNIHVRGESITGVPTGKDTYRTIRNASTLERQVQEAIPTLGEAEPSATSIQLRLDASNGKPNAIFLDTTGLNTRTSSTDIDTQLARGRMSETVAVISQANLTRQAQLFGVPREQAHLYTGEELTREATRIAAANNLDLYVKKGKNYELVPKDVVRTDARLNNGDNLAPEPISNEAAGAYVESKTSDIGPAQIREIMDAIEQGVDISDRLPSDLLPHYQAIRDNDRAGIDTSERRAFIDMLNDMNTLLGEEGSIGWRDFTREQRMAAQRLQADMRKAGKSTREFLFGARPEDVAMFEGYLDRINNPVPPDSTNPRNMRFDPENKIRGDRVVKHRVIREASGSTPSLEAPPLWNSEVTALQNARDIKPGGTEWDLKSPIRQHKAAGTEFIYYGYRTAQKNLNAELNVLHKDMQEIARGFSSSSLENVGANGYARQGGDGQRILTFNKVTPRPLTSAERRLQAALDTIYANLFERIQETRAATGREPLKQVDDYQTFARTISLLNHLGINVDLARDSSDSIHAKYINHKATTFPYTVRKHAFYTAEMNALKILDTYAQAALKDIHMSPFIAKLHELIETNLPAPVTGEENWSLKDHKQGLYTELSRWKEYLSTGTNADIHPTARRIMNIVNNNMAYSLLSGSLRSAGIQFSSLVGTTYALGVIPTLKSAGEVLAGHVAHPFTGGTAREFAIRNSEILSSRKFTEAYSQAAAAIIGRRPRDIAHAIRVGDFGSIQQAAGRPGFKLLEIFDMEAAVVSWNAAYKIARNPKMGYSHKDAVRYADDLVVRTQGSTMPGDLTGVQRNARGKLLTQFQTFLINDFNFLREEVLTKGKPGGGGGGNIPPGGVPSGSGSWETGDPRTRTQFAINVLRLLVYTQIVNELYKMLHLQPGLPDPVEDVRRGIRQKHGPVMLAWDIAVGQSERLPIVGGGLRYGKGVTGPALQIVEDLFRAGRVDPLTSNPYKKQMEAIGLPKDVGGLIEPTGSLLGVPYVRQVSKTAKAQVRGENIWDSLMGWYSQERGSRGRERGERRERRSR